MYTKPFDIMTVKVIKHLSIKSEKSTFSTYLSVKSWILSTIPNPGMISVQNSTIWQIRPEK